MALSIQERLKNLRVERRLTLEQLAEQTGYLNQLLVAMNPMIIKTSATMPLTDWQTSTV